MKIFPTLVTVAILSSPTLLFAQTQTETQKQTPTNIEPRSTKGMPENNPSYTKEQLITSTVHQAWLISGKNEATFFDMVEQLAQISANNRSLTLPDSAAAGRRMGEYIKRAARSDTDQLLYAVVDKAVLMATHAPAHAAAGSKPASKPAR